MPKPNRNKEDRKKLADELVDLAQPPQLPAPMKRLPGRAGRGEAAPFSVQQLAKNYTEDALATILEIMQSSESEDSTRLEAAKVVLDRGWGKATLKVQAETVKYTLQDLEKKLLENKEHNDKKWEEARRLEDDRLGQYITVDAEVIEDPAAHREGTLHNSEEGSRGGALRLFANSDADNLFDLEVARTETDGARSNSKAASDLLDDCFEFDGVQALE